MICWSSHDIYSDRIFSNIFSVQSCSVCDNVLECTPKGECAIELFIFMGPGSFEKNVEHYFINNNDHKNPSKLGNDRSCCKNQNVKTMLFKEKNMCGISKLIISKLIWKNFLDKTQENSPIPLQISIHGIFYSLRSFVMKHSHFFRQSSKSVVSSYNGKWFLFKEGDIISEITNISEFLKNKDYIEHILYERE